MYWTILLLIFSNAFMNTAWYGHLKWFPKLALFATILISWGIAFFEYCLQVPANRIGAQSGLQPYQLKIIQEILSISTFMVFALLVFGETPRWNHWVAFALIIGAVCFAVLPAK